MSGGAVVAQKVNTQNPYMNITERLEQAYQRAERIAQLIETVDGKLHGQYPKEIPEGDVDKIICEPNGYMETVTFQVSRLHEVLDKAEQAIDKLEGKVNC